MLKSRQARPNQGPGQDVGGKVFIVSYPRSRNQQGCQGDQRAQARQGQAVLLVHQLYLHVASRLVAIIIIIILVQEYIRADIVVG